MTRGIPITRQRALQVSGRSLARNDIPDIDILHSRYDARQLGLSDGDLVSQWDDESGNGHNLSVNGDPTFRKNAVHGLDAIQFDGSDDAMQVTWTSISQPNTVGVLLEPLTVDVNGHFVENKTDGDTSNRATVQVLGEDPDWRIYAGGSTVDGGTPTTEPHIITAKFDGSDSLLRADGYEVLSGDPGDNPYDGLSVGADIDSNSHYYEGYIVEVLVYDGDACMEDIEKYLNRDTSII